MVPGSCLVSMFVCCARYSKAFVKNGLSRKRSMAVLYKYWQKDLVDLKYSFVKVEICLLKARGGRVAEE